MITGNEAQAEADALHINSGVGSGEGLAVSLTRHTRVLMIFDEFERFLKKAGADGSILGSIVNELFDSLEFSNVTRDRETVLKNAHLGFLTNMPLQQFEEMSGVKQLVDVGLWNRFMFVVGTRRHKCPVATAPDPQQVKNLKNRLGAAFSKLPVGNEPELVLRWTDEARELWSRTEDVIGLDESATRLDEIGARLLAVFTVTSEKTEIDAETVRAVFAFLKYQRKVRELYKPSQAETKEAAIEQAILKQLKQRGPLSPRQLRQYTHADRYGIEKFQAALKALSEGEDRQIKKVEGAKYQLIEE